MKFKFFQIISLVLILCLALPMPVYSADLQRPQAAPTINFTILTLTIFTAIWKPPGLTPALRG